jgi:hypothetical protein
MAEKTEMTPTSPPPSKPSREEEARQVVQEYIDDQKGSLRSSAKRSKAQQLGFQDKRCNSCLGARFSKRTVGPSSHRSPVSTGTGSVGAL